MPREPGPSVPFELPSPSFELDVDIFAERVIASAAKVAIVVTPNNPTSLAVPRNDHSAPRCKTGNGGLHAGSR